MAVFYCSACGEALTGNLNQWTEVLKTDDDHERDPATRLAVPTVPRSFFAIDPEPWGAPYIVHDDPDWGGPFQSRCSSWATDEGEMHSAGPRNTVVLNPYDVARLTPMETADGCCGPMGWSGPNQACRCGAPVGTLAANCCGPHEFHLDPSRTHAQGSIVVPQCSTATGLTAADICRR